MKNKSEIPPLEKPTIDEKCEVLLILWSESATF